MDLYEAGNIKSLENRIKDTIWVDSQSSIQYLIKKKYFRKKVIKDKGTKNEYVSYFFFRYKEDKMLFMKEYYKKLSKTDGIREIHDKIGLLFGYPPKAVQKFHSRDYTSNIYFNFCGMVFSSYPETIIEDVKWLLLNKPLIEGEVIEIEKGVITLKRESVTIGDYDWERKLQNLVLKYSSN
ncbi:gp108 [Bacillus phage G]|uniref:Gp108 n=1 Tax=Bacillus phage G TaxID=2884420 RepID=G3MBH0_9CAUD|nr:gp108 [Bacillus phage G]AEO93370.1 gp108 [Bacillus phage G]